MYKNTKTFIINRITFVFLLFPVIAFFQCARVIAPQGGPKDVAPPEILKTEPQNFSTNFNNKKFSIDFDEYIQLKSINQELLVSPPIIEEPEILLKGKSLLVKFTEDLPDSTTVNFNFHEGIADYNEGNILSDFQYVFSTGSIIDTLFMNGVIVNANDMTPVEKAYIMFYKNTEDSVPQTIKPSFICKSNKNGEFTIRNMSPGNYKVFALADANNNMLFDLPTESIAFFDTLVSPMVTVETLVDSTNKDSVFTYNQVISATDSLFLYMFEELNPVQYLDSKTRNEKGRKISFYFTESLIEPLKIHLLDSTINHPWYILEENPTRDTLVYWISDTTLVKRDTLGLIIDYHVYDSLKMPYLISDTIQVVSEEEKDKKSEKGRGRLLKKLLNEEEDTIVVSELTIGSNIKSRTLALKSDLLLKPKFPVRNVDPSKIYLYYLEDTLVNEIKFDFFVDTVKHRAYHIKYPFEESGFYRILIDTNTFEDIYGNKNDTAIFNFKIQKESFYGNINLKLKNVENPYILQLQNEKGKVLREYQIDTNTKKLGIKLLAASKYRLMLVNDTNKNGKWDTGSYDEKIQPEHVFYFPKMIKIKAGWDNDISWDLRNLPFKVNMNSKKPK